MALAVVAAVAFAGCTSHHAVSQHRQTIQSPAVRHQSPARLTGYRACTAGDLTGELGVRGEGAGRFTRNVVLINTSGHTCMLAGGPSKVTGVRRGGRRIMLATGAPLAAYGLVGPAILQPGQSAQAAITTTTMCQKAVEGQADNFAALDIGIARSGEVRISFPPSQPYNAVCGIWASTFGVPARNRGACTAAQLGAALQGSSEPGTSGTALGTLYVWDVSGSSCMLPGPVTVTGLDQAGRSVTTSFLFMIMPGSPPLSADGIAPGQHGRMPDHEVWAAMVLIGDPTLACPARPVDPASWRIVLPSGGSVTAPNTSTASGPALTNHGGLTTCGNRLGGQSPLLIAPA